MFTKVYEYSSRLDVDLTHWLYLSVCLYLIATFFGPSLCLVLAVWQELSDQEALRKAPLGGRFEPRPAAATQQAGGAGSVSHRQPDRARVDSCRRRRYAVPRLLGHESGGHKRWQGAPRPNAAGRENCVRILGPSRGDYAEGGGRGTCT